MEAHVTLCSMGVEWGARAGMVTPDAVTYEFLRGRRYVPARPAWDEAVTAWDRLSTDPGATFDREVTIDAAEVAPYVTRHQSDPGTPLSNVVPDPGTLPDAARESARRALAYMALSPGTLLRSINVDAVFVGSCTKGRLGRVDRAVGRWSSRCRNLQAAPLAQGRDILKLGVTA